MYIIAAQRHGLIQCTHVRWNPGLSDTATAGRYKGVSRTKGPMAGISYRHDTATKCGAGHKSALDALALSAQPTFDHRQMFLLLQSQK